MPINRELIESIMRMDTKTRFRYFMRFENNKDKMWKEAFKKVRYGINTEFDIVKALIDGNVMYDEKNRKMLIGGKNGKSVDPAEYEIEMIRREALMDEIIEKKATTDDIYSND